MKSSHDETYDDEDLTKRIQSIWKDDEYNDTTPEKVNSLNNKLEFIQSTDDEFKETTTILQEKVRQLENDLKILKSTIKNNNDKRSEKGSPRETTTTLQQQPISQQTQPHQKTISLDIEQPGSPIESTEDPHSIQPQLTISGEIHPPTETEEIKLTDEEYLHEYNNEIWEKNKLILNILRIIPRSFWNNLFFQDTELENKMKLFDDNIRKIEINMATIDGYNRDTEAHQAAIRKLEHDNQSIQNEIEFKEKELTELAFEYEIDTEVKKSAKKNEIQHKQNKRNANNDEIKSREQQISEQYRLIDNIINDSMKIRNQSKILRTQINSVIEKGISNISRIPSNENIPKVEQTIREKEKYEKDMFKTLSKIFKKMKNKKNTIINDDTDMSDSESVINRKRILESKRMYKRKRTKHVHEMDS